MTYVIEHKHEHCCGRWVLLGAALPAKQVIACESCYAHVELTPSRAQAANRENDLGKLLEGLAREGIQLLD